MPHNPGQVNSFVGYVMQTPSSEDEAPVSVGALHALIYCERLFYLESVERQLRADAAVYAGRRLHDALEEGESLEHRRLESDTLGVMGEVDVIRTREGALIPYEHKKGRSAGRRGEREAWDSDRVQLGAYAMLLELAEGRVISEGRIRYHQDKVTLRVPIDDVLRGWVRAAVDRARVLRARMERPPVHERPSRCEGCSLAPVCLPEETRLAADPRARPVRLLPPHPQGYALHVADHGSKVVRDGESLAVVDRKGHRTRVPAEELDQVVIHGAAQITSQALRLCVSKEIGVHWLTNTGGVVGALAPGARPGRRHLRQFEALRDPELSLSLARRLIQAKVENHLAYGLRQTRGARSDEVEKGLERLRQARRQVPFVESRERLLGVEGSAALGFFSLLPHLLKADLDPRLRYAGRHRRPPRDRVNALLSYGYGMLYRSVLQSIVSVGLHPGVGFYHRPRSAGHTLAMDVMELFRLPLVEMPVLGAVNRGMFDVREDFIEVPGRVGLTDQGRWKLISLLERRRADVWRHPVTGYSLSYARTVELEVRLLEKEWCDEGGLFARLRLR